jgi:mono/diheme cytochrome c family protein
MSQPNEGQDRLDYRETSDITEVHASVIREYPEPRAGSMPIPTWVGVLSAAALCWAGVYVGMFHGGFKGTVYNEYESSPAVFFPLKSGQQGGGAAEEVPLLALGEKVYASTCATCHQANGGGNPAMQAPPIAGSEWVDGAEYSDKRLLAILLKGLKGPVSVKGNTYNGVMPAWGQSLKPRQIAAVATYIRQAWGNKGTGEITEAQVAAAKKDKVIADQLDNWTIEQIKAMPVSESLPGGGPAVATDAAAAPAAAPGGAAPTAGAAPAGGAPAPAAGAFDLAGSVNRGKPLYTLTCMACHQPTGMGLPGAFPPLAGQEWVTGDSRRLIAITLKGIMGAMTVDGKIYATGMPSPVMTFAQLKDDKNLSDVLNYVRNSFGNKATEAITPEMVARVRAEFAADPAPFSEATLKAFK